jgi:secondary thiamine-phosphate synthase enzyme
MDSVVITVYTGGLRGVFDITGEVADFTAGRGDGIVSIFVPHATAGVAIFETGAGSDSDVMKAVDSLFPRDDRWRHRHGSDGHGADHVMPAFISPGITVPVLEGRPALGTWQSILLIDPNQDNSRRNVRLSWIQG